MNSELSSHADMVLFLLLFLLCPALVVSGDLGDSVRVVYLDTLQKSVDTPASGIALASGRVGDLYVLSDNPPRVIWLNERGELTGEVEGILLGLSQPADMHFANMNMLLICDAWASRIERLGRRLNREEYIPIPGEVERAEPVSICTDDQGLIYIVNDFDGDVWRIDRNNVASSLGGSVMRGGWLDDPRRIRYDGRLGLVILERSRLTICTTRGKIRRQAPIPRENVNGIAVSGDEIWLAGGELYSYNLKDDQVRLHAPADSLQRWGVHPAADLAMQNDSTLAVLGRNGGLIARFRIIRLE